MNFIINLWLGVIIVSGINLYELLKLVRHIFQIESISEDSEKS